MHSSIYLDLTCERVSIDLDTSIAGRTLLSIVGLCDDSTAQRLVLDDAQVVQLYEVLTFARSKIAEREMQRRKCRCIHYAGDNPRCPIHFAGDTCHMTDDEHAAAADAALKEAIEQRMVRPEVIA